MTRVVRSFPATIPPGRSYVVDQLERVIVDNYDLSPIGEIGEDVVVCEWDIAFGAETMQAFVERAERSPDRVLYAPYLLYPEAEALACYRSMPGTWVKPAASWSGKVYEDAGPGLYCRPITPADATCHVFGFGLTYLPYQMIKDFLSEKKATEIMDDATFSWWHYGHAAHRDVQLAWDLRPVHLHWELEEISDGNG